MKKTLRIVLVVLAALLGLLMVLWIALHLIPFQSNLFLASDPWEVSPKWYCKEMDMTIQFSSDENGKLLGDTVEPFTWNGTDYEVQVCFRAKTISFLKGQNIPEDQLLVGEWKYVGDNMVISVGQNSVFGDEVETLTFVPVG